MGGRHPDEGEPGRAGRCPSDVNASTTAEWVEPQAPPRGSRARLRDPGGADPDAELVALWQQGEASAFEELVRRHEARVYRFVARMLGDAAEAEDVTQETFLSLHRHGHRFRGEARFSTFVYRVASNAALNRRRGLARRGARHRRLAERQAGGADLPPAPPDPEAAAVGAQLERRLTRALGEVPDRLRVPLLLYDVEGLGYAEIAATLGTPEGTVKSRIHRARRLLRQALAPLLDADADAAEGSR